MADYGILQTASDFETTIAGVAAQEKFMTTCNRLRNANDRSGAGAFVRRVDNSDGEVYCVFEEFKRWMVEVKGENYPDAFTTECISPCVRIEKFRYLISEFSNFLRLRGLPSLGKTSYIQAFGNTYSDTLRFDIKRELPCGDRRSIMTSCRPLIMVQLYFNATFKFNSPANVVDPAYDAFDALTNEVGDGSCSVADKYTSADCTAAGGTWVGPIPTLFPRHTANRYVGVETEKVLLSSAVWGTVFSLFLSGLMILIATNNYLVTSWSLLVIVLVVNAVVGSMVILGWTLGVVESICLTICVGLSVDYTIHLCHIFATSSATTRFGAGRDALASMGVSVFNAAITTIGSSVVLMLSYIIFFQRFGIFVFMNIFYSTAFAFVFLMAILMVIGPIQGAGRMMKKDKGAGDPTADNETANPVLDDGDVADT
jgi:predicted RND superfamily exporter protein